MIFNFLVYNSLRILVGKKPSMTRSHRDAKRLRREATATRMPPKNFFETKPKEKAKNKMIMLFQRSKVQTVKAF